MGGVRRSQCTAGLTPIALSPLGETGAKKLPRVQLLGARTILGEALAAAILEQEYDIAADV